jgi:hypothetical protein
MRRVVLVLVLGLWAPQALAQAAPKDAAPRTPPAAPKDAAPKDAAPAAEAKPLRESLTGAALAEYEAGRVLYQDGDYGGALLKFQASYDLSKDYRLLWNMAACEKNLRRYARVLNLIERYLAEGGAQLSTADRDDAKTLAETVAAFVGTVTIAVNEAGASVAVDGESVGTSPLPAPVRLDMGSRSLTVKKPGFVDYAATLPVRGGQASTTEVKLVQESNDGRLRIVTDDGVTIRVDGKIVGTGEWEGTLAAGVHTVSLSAPGKRPYKGDVVVRKGELSTSRLSLEKEGVLAEEKKKGGALPWVIGGGALLAGAVVGGYFLLKPEDKEWKPEQGTMEPGTIRLPLRF